MNKIIPITDLPIDEQEWFKEYVKFVIVIDNTPVGGYATMEIAERELPYVLKEHEEYGTI